MEEKIVIENFAGIKHIELSLREINVLIGPQASGKSICVKLLYYFKNLPYKILRSAENVESKTEFKKVLERDFKQYFPPSTWPKESFKIRYELNQVYIEIEKRQSKEGLGVLYSSEYNKTRIVLMNNFKKFKQEQTEENKLWYNNISKIRSAYLENIKTHIDAKAPYDQLFIPAGRSYFAFLQSNIFSFLSSKNAIDPFIAEFGSFYELFKSFNARVFDNNDYYIQMDALFRALLKGKYVYSQEEDLIIQDDGRKIPVINSSSGQQEILPLALILKEIPFINFWDFGLSVYIEEPEAHLFPLAQKLIVELMAITYNTKKVPMQFFITTHSPYILTAFNNLLQAGHIDSSTMMSKNKLYKIVPQKHIVNPGIFRAYTLSGGEAECICSKENGLINTNIIDDVSNELAIQFDKLLDLE